MIFSVDECCFKFRLTIWIIWNGLSVRLWSIVNNSSFITSHNTTSTHHYPCHNTPKMTKSVPKFSFIFVVQHIWYPSFVLKFVSNNLSNHWFWNSWDISMKLVHSVADSSYQQFVCFTDDRRPLGQFVEKFQQDECFLRLNTNWHSWTRTVCWMI